MKTDDRLEQQIRDLFSHVVADEPPLTSRAPHRSASARQWSMFPMAAKFASGVALVATMTAGALVAARDEEPRQTPGNFAAPGSTASATATPTASASGAPSSSLVPYRDTRLGYSLLHPRDWRSTTDADLPGTYRAFVSPSDASGTRFVFWQQQGATCEKCPTAVPIELKNFATHAEYVRIARSIIARWKTQGVRVTETTVTVAGRRAPSFHVVFPDRPAADRQDQEWCRGCVGDWHLVSWYDDTTLDVRIVALDGPAYARDGAEARAIVRSLRDIGRPTSRLSQPTSADPGTLTDPRPTPPASQAPECPLRNNGSLMTTVKCDEATDAVLRFAAARIDGKGADAWLTTAALSRYEKHEGGLWLYTPDGERPYRSYFVTARSTTGDGRVRFTLEMNQGYVGDNGDRVRIEHVYAGRTTGARGETANGWAIVDAELTEEPSQP